MNFEKLKISDLPLVINILFFILASLIKAQDSNLKLDQISLNEGLSNSVVNVIFQDKKEYLWFGTQDGLNKFDGYNFTVYKYHPNDSLSIQDNWIETIAEDNYGRLWIGTQRGGVSVFDPEKEMFVNFSHSSQNKNSLLNNRVWDVKVEDSNTVWIGTASGLDKFNISQNKFTHYVHNAIDTNSISSRSVNAIYIDDAGNLWLGMWGNGLNKFDRKKNKFIHFRFDNGKNDFSGRNKIKSIRKLNDHKILLGTKAGLLVFDIYNYSWSPFIPADNFNFGKYTILSILKDDSGNIWLGTHHNGILKIDGKTNLVTKYSANLLNKDFLQDNWVHAILEDKTHNIWFGTGKGIEKYTPLKQKFINIVHNPYDKNTISQGEVLSVCEDSDGFVWLGTWNGGLNRFNSVKNEFKLYVNDPKDPNSLPNNIVWSVLEDHNKNIWVGTYNGLAKFDKKKEKFKIFKHNHKDSTSISFSNISTIFEDLNHNLWVGTWGGGINLFDSTGNKITYFIHNQNDSTSLSDNLINVIFQDKDNRIWIGTNSGGLNLYNPMSNDFSHFTYDPENKFSLSNNSVKSIYEDNNGYLWIGTAGGGLNKFDIDSKKFYRFTEDNGLSNNSVNNIIGDFSNNLWLCTNFGLSRFNLKTEKFLNYYEEDGITGNQLNSSGIMCKDGSIFIGGMGGATVFFPKQIVINKRKPPVVITAVKKVNKRLKILKDANNVDKVSLNYNENTFSIEFAALDYSNPKKNKYAYKLIGFNKDWIYAGNERIAHYTNIDPGIYVFRVKASNNDGIWNEDGASVVIEIIPPFWATIWFRVLVGLILLGLIFWMFRRKIKSVEIQNIKLEKLVKKRTAELEKEISDRIKAEEALKKSEKELIKSNQNKDKFFSIIAHDLKSPFSSLLGYSGWLKNEINNLSKEELNNSISNMNKSIQKVYELIQNLLEWARIQNGRVEYNPSSFDLKKLIDNTIGYIEFKALNKDIKISNKVKEKLFVYADQNMLNSVFQNLLTNSLKFSHPGDEIKITSKTSGGFVVVSISDNGVGIEKDKLETIFDIGSHHTTLGTKAERGTGLGLILCKELIERNKGKIWAESEKGKGSVFSFTVPLTSAIYKIEKSIQ